MRQINILTKLFFENLVRDKFFVFIFFIGAVFALISVLFNEISYGADDFVIRSFSHGFLSISLNFLSIYFGLSLVHSEAMKSSIVLLLCKPIRRIDLILGAVFAFVAALTVSLLFAIIEFRVILGAYDFKLDAHFYYGLVGVFFEACLMFLISMLLRLFTNSLISVFFVIALYFLGHGIEDLLNLQFFADNQNLREVMSFISKILPSFSKFNFKDLAVDAINSKIIWSGTLYFSLAFGVICSAIGFIFSRRDYS